MCALPVFAWAIVSYLYAFPGFVLRLTIWDLIGTASYMLAFAMLESWIITAPFVLLAIILPAPLLKDRFVVFTAIIVVVSSIWIMYANYHQINLADWDLVQSWPTLVLYLVSLAIPVMLVTRTKRLEEMVESAIQRVAVLVYVYAALACVGFLVILIRNL